MNGQSALFIKLEEEFFTNIDNHLESYDAVSRNTYEFSEFESLTNDDLRILGDLTTADVLPLIDKVNGRLSTQYKSGSVIGYHGFKGITVDVAIKL